ncbi:hypothetical protein ASG01_01010 [Chryseobacterium sp. Leaf180]|uniref:GLPGLI family protein n=1 Tax=Chryseobacterium sp. Leaf180 TaxID=1736289 RepID=UPI0006FCFBE4|nr:GLPGLI family protein [Chryseobacterium sp. Leaf180]KQR94493.1 hypothetical protein ASG01_01010 [Chryseobacterium sp. Leaf180]
MKKIFTLCAVLICFSTFAQNRFFYEYKFIPDSTNRADVKTEMMLLDIDEKGSKYYSQDKFLSDSTSQADLEKQIKTGSTNLTLSRREKPGQVAYKVTKDYPDFKTYLFTRISSDMYKIEEDKKPEWKILAEKQKIGSYSAQKATTNFGGREWTAWFTTELPFQDGPYKFYGLPGLIVKIEDKTGSHNMTLVGNKKMPMRVEKDVETPGGVQIYGMGGKEVMINKNQFIKAWKSYVNDPTKNMREMMMKNNENNKVVFKTTSADGKEISDPNQVFREIEKRTKENLKKNNNPIEPELYGK